MGRLNKVPFNLPSSPGFFRMSLPSDLSLKGVLGGICLTWPVQASSISELSQVPNCRTAPGLSRVLDLFEMVSGVILLWRSGDLLGPFFRPWASTAELLNQNVEGAGVSAPSHVEVSQQGS